MNSVFEIFKIGIGPSSSHTVGPMKAAKLFMNYLRDKFGMEERDTPYCAGELKVELYGSLASTGVGHGTDKAIILGLLGYTPDKVEIDAIDSLLVKVRKDRQISISNDSWLSFELPQAIQFKRGKLLPLHSNGMRFVFTTDSGFHFEKIYYSIGGGFLLEPDQQTNDSSSESDSQPDSVYPYPFTSSRELLDLCQRHGTSISELVFQNELSQRSQDIIDQHIENIWNVMHTTIQRGCHQTGLLPGSLEVERRASGLYQQLSRRQLGDQLTALDWVNLWAIATNEENAAGGRIVTAPTNGAAGIIPAVLSYYDRFQESLTIPILRDFFLTATAICSLYKRNASISGAEVGCQGEVGVACSMAAAGLVSILGGSNLQIENAAEIGMEHNLGLTCDPIGGLVQIPCIERNAMGATKAISAARLALYGSGRHKVSLDRVIATMRRTGLDMKSKYKETSRGGLAVNSVDC